MARVITYECDECGCEVVVTKTAETELSPLYCCGIELSQVSAAEEKAAKTVRKTSARKPAKPVKKAPKTLAKKITAKKKPASSKRASVR